MGKTDEARATLDQARQQYPRSEELVGLDAAILVRAKQPKEADRVLAEFLAQDPDNVAVALMRAQVLADLLGNARRPASSWSTSPSGATTRPRWSSSPCST